MNAFDRWMLKRIIAKEVRQGPTHPRNIENLYGFIRRAVVEEFHETSRQSLQDYLMERFAMDQARDD